MPGSERGGEWELLLKMYDISLMQDEKVLVDSRAVLTNLFLTVMKKVVPFGPSWCEAIVNPL